MTVFDLLTLRPIDNDRSFISKILTLCNKQNYGLNIWITVVFGWPSNRSVSLSLRFRATDPISDRIKRLYSSSQKNLHEWIMHRWKNNIRAFNIFKNWVYQIYFTIDLFYKNIIVLLIHLHYIQWWIRSYNHILSKCYMYIILESTFCNLLSKRKNQNWNNIYIKLHSFTGAQSFWIWLLHISQFGEK